MTPGATGGVVDETLSGLNAAVSDLLTLEHVQRRRTKLSRSGFDERHLFLVADETPIPFPVAYALVGWDELVPPEPLGLPEDLTHLWLLVLFSPRLLLAGSTGWVAIPRDDVTA